MSISLNPTNTIPEAGKTGASAPTTTSTSKESAKSVRAKAAIEKFEGLFMSMMVKQLRESSFGEGLFPNDASDTYGGMFDMFMGDHLARSGDVGLERLFSSSTAIKQLEEYVSPGRTPEMRSKGIEEYRNEQLRTSAFAASGT